MKLAEKLEIWGFEEGITVFRDGSVGFGFRLPLRDISCATDEEVNAHRSRLMTFLGSLPSGLDIQFVQIISREENRTLHRHLALASAAAPVVQTMANARIRRLEDLNERGALPRPDGFLFARVTGQKPKEKFFTLLGNRRAGAEAEFTRSLARAKAFAAEIERNLEGSKRLTPQEIINLTFETWNPAHPLGPGEFDEADVRDRMLVSELVKEVKGFRLGSVHHRVMTLKILPEETTAGMAQVLMGLPFASQILLSVHVPDQSKEIEWLKLNRRMAYAMVAGKKGVSDVESEAKLENIESLLSEVVKGGEKIFHASLAIVLRSEVEAELDAQVGYVLQLFRNLNGSEGLMETYAAFDIFAAASVPNARNRERTRRLKSSNLADLLPVFGEWRGFERPAMLLRTRTGALFPFDPFSASLTNANQIISGGSGAGKSYLTNLMLGQMLSQNPRVFILDVGASYEKSCNLLGGQYIPLSLSSSLTMNPFDGAVTDERIKFLTALVQIMVREEDRQAIGRLEKAEIEHAIRAVYAEEAAPRLSHLRQKLLESEVEEVKRIGKILSLWTGDSPYGKFLDRVTNINIEKRIVCFDLKGLASNPDLQAAALFTITDMVWREVQKDRSEMKFLVFDECWRLLENDTGSQFVAEVFRTFRKYYASAIAISQNIDDFAKSKAASAIMPNSSVKWVLKQPGADFKRLAEVLRLNERETDLVAGLSQVKGEFSEALLIAENRRAVVSIESTPLEYWLATTDPRDFQLMKQKEGETGKIGTDLLADLAENFPKGAAFAAEGGSQ